MTSPSPTTNRAGFAQTRTHEPPRPKSRYNSPIIFKRTLLPGLRQRLESHFGCPVLDVTGVLSQFALPQFTLHQSADGSVHMKVRRTAIDMIQIREALLGLFGADQVLTIEEFDLLEGTGGKVIQYTSD